MPVERLLLSIYDYINLNPIGAHSQKTDANSLCFLGSSCEGSRVFIFDTHVFRGPVPAVIGFATAKLR